jgi:F-type H+-transporting ATPase subunit b
VSSRAFYVPWYVLAALAVGWAFGAGTFGRLARADDVPSAADSAADVDGKVTAPRDDHAELSADHEAAGHDTDAEADGADAEAEHHDDGAHHDPYDLSHANASAALEDPAEIRYDMAICTFVVFLVLLILLRVFAWGRIMTGLERRETAIAARIEEAERNAEESAAQLQAYQDKMAASAQEAQEIIAQARRDAEAVAEKIRAEAQEDAERERRRAMADIQDAKNAALRDVAEKGADMAVLLAGRIVRRELKPQDYSELISEALGQFPSNN